MQHGGMLTNYANKSALVCAIPGAVPLMAPSKRKEHEGGRIGSSFTDEVPASKN